MKIAVIISTWNREKFVGEAVESVLEQKNFVDEIIRTIVVDDGSQDGTAVKLIQRFDLRPAGPNRYESESVTLMTLPNRERGAARNAGAAVARKEFAADWLIFLDSDDRLDVGAISGFLARLGSSQPIAIYANSRTWDGHASFGPLRLSENAPSGDLSEFVLTHSLLSIGSTFIRADAFEKAGGFPEDRRMAGSEDWVLHARLCFLGPVEYSSHVSLHYRRHSGNTSAERFHDSIMRSRLEIEKDLDCVFGERSRRVRRRMWRHAWLSIAGTFNSVGEGRRAAAILRETWAHDPGLMASPRFWRLGASIVNGLLRNSP